MKKPNKSSKNRYDNLGRTIEITRKEFVDMNRGKLQELIKNRKSKKGDSND